MGAQSDQALKRDQKRTKAQSFKKRDQKLKA